MKYCNKSGSCQWIASTVYPNIRSKKNELINDINLNLNESKLLIEKFALDENIPMDYIGRKFIDEIKELNKDIDTITNDLNTYSSNLDNEISCAINNHYRHYYNYLESLKIKQDDKLKEDTLE